MQQSQTNLKTQYPHVYAIGDVNSVGTPKAGVFAEGAAKTAAASIIAEFERDETPLPYQGAGTCYVEFGNGQVGKVDVDFFSGPAPVGTHTEASVGLVADKEYFGSSHAERWFGCRLVKILNFLLLMACLAINSRKKLVSKVFV